LSRESFGPDVPASLTTAELRQLVEGSRFIRTALTHPVDKDKMAGELSPMRRLFTKSIVARTDLRTGTILQAKHLAFKKPGTGIPPDRLQEIIGRKLAHAVQADALITENDLAL